MRILSSIVEPFMLTMFDPQAHILASCSVGFELVGDQNAGRFGRPLEELSHKPPCGCSVPAALNENVEDEAILIDGAPEPMFPAADRDHNLVQVPFVATRRGLTANAVGIFPTEFLRPAADTFVAHVNAPSSKHLLNHPKAALSRCWRLTATRWGICDLRQQRPSPSIAETLGLESLSWCDGM
jgi:hypothetical protein